MLIVPVKLAVRAVDVPLSKVTVGIFRSGSAKAVMGTFTTEFIETVTVPKEVVPSKK